MYNLLVFYNINDIVLLKNLFKFSLYCNILFILLSLLLTSILQSVIFFPQLAFSQQISNLNSNIQHNLQSPHYMDMTKDAQPNQTSAHLLKFYVIIMELL
jgi:hypothetical protein